MSEVSSVDIINLILGILGTGTGIIALLIYYLRLRWERPQLKDEILDCSHQFGTKKNGTPIKIYIEPRFRIKNIGNRGTNISEMHISFSVDHKRYSAKDAVYVHLGTMTRYSERKWIEANETVEIAPTFKIDYEGPMRDSIECVFALFYAHGKLTIQGLSTKRP